MSDTDHAFGLTDALLIVMAVIWGVNFSAVKYATQVLPPAVFTLVRVCAAAATLAAVALALRRPWPPRRDVLAVAALGLLGNGVYQLLFVNGVSRTRIADAALIIAAAPACIALLGRLGGVERVHRRALLGVALSILGVGIVIFGNTRLPQRDGSLLGAALVVGGVVCWSAFTVLLRPYTARVDPVQLNAASMAGGILPLLVAAPEASRVSWAALPPLAWVALFYSSIISMGVAYLFWYRGVRVIGPTRTSVYGNLQPVVAILVAWIFLRETPTAWQGAGAATIISGILLTRT